MADKKMSGQEVLEEAFRQYDKTYYDEFPIVDETIQFDESYYKSMERQVKRAQRNRFSLNTMGKRAIGIAIACVLFLGCSISAFAVREPLSAFLFYIYEEHIAPFLKNTPQMIETVYLPKYLPDGYTVSECHIENKTTKLIWRNSKNEEIIFSQSIALTSDIHNEEYEILTLSDIKIAYYNKSNKKFFIWNADGYVFECIIPDILSNEECFTIIEKTSAHISGDECLLTKPKDCTVYQECLFCKRRLGTPNSVHIGDGTWIYEDAMNHYAHCKGETVLGNLCEATIRAEHYFENDICIGCGCAKNIKKE